MTGLFFSEPAPTDGYGGHDHLSPDIYEESETDAGTEDLSTRIFVALFDYDPLTMSPNPDAAEEELPFKEGQIIKVSSEHKGNKRHFHKLLCALGKSRLSDPNPAGFLLQRFRLEIPLDLVINIKC